MIFYIYILYSASYDKYYVGHSEDPWRRLEEHNTGKLHRFTSDYRPWKLSGVYQINGTRGDALKIERIIKRQKSKTFIIKMLITDFIPTGPLAHLVRVPHVRD